MGVRVDERLPDAETDGLSRVLSGLVPAVVLLVVLALAMAPFRDRLNTGTIALVFLLPVLVSAVGGVWVALGVAAVGAATFNFFFTVPYHSFRIESGESVAALIAYVVVAAIVAVAASRRRSAISLAGRRGWDEQFLLATISDIAGVTDPEESILTGLGGVRTVTNLRGISLVADDTWLGTVREGRGDDTRAREVAERAADAARRGLPTDSTAARPAGPVAVLVGAAERPLGALGADPGERRLSDDEYRMLELFAGVLTLALRREPGAGTARLDQP